MNVSLIIQITKSIKPKRKKKKKKKSTSHMDFDSYSNRLSDLTEYYSEVLQKPNPV